MLMVPARERVGRTPMDLAAEVVVLVVGFRNPADVAACVRALAGAPPEPSFEIFIAENGGPKAMDAVVRSLLAEGGLHPCVADADVPAEPRLVRRQRLQWESPDGTRRIGVNVAETTENLGYAGGVNAWLRPLLQVPGWTGAWILNPDAEPSPRALAELVAYAAERDKPMVGSRLLVSPDADYVHSRGLAWRKLAAKTAAVDFRTQGMQAPDPDDVDARLDAPSGASLYVTRALVEAIGLMDERYFLYFEDLEWGMRAKPFGGVGYAHASVVPHKGGTTTRAADRSPSALTTYLEFRNRILFTRSRYPAWLPWTIAMQVVHVALLFLRGPRTRVVVAVRGIVAGVLGEVGRPDHIIGARG
jgi:N-acetylglucosaminyl-diphospho-decaprenol L-rhamnosyltransferase